MPENAARLENTQPTVAEQNQLNAGSWAGSKIQPATLTIDRIEPRGTVEEGTPIRVFYTVDNIAPAEWNGYVTYDGAAAAGAGPLSVQVKNIAANDSIKGMVAGRAPLLSDQQLLYKSI